MHYSTLVISILIYYEFINFVHKIFLFVQARQLKLLSKEAQASHNDQFCHIMDLVVISQIAAPQGDNIILPHLCENEVLKDSNLCIKRSLYCLLFCALIIFQL